jgi:transcriptional regulator with XRE-family HTH domain
MDDILRRLGRRIRELRIERGISSQETFADYLGMHRTFVGHLETGRKDFRLTTIIRVADALGATLSELFYGLENSESVSKVAIGVKRGRQKVSLDRSRVLTEVAIL